MDTRYLEQRRQGWYVVRDVPAKLVPLVGRKRLRASLKTRDLRVAQHRRWAILSKLNAQTANAEARTGGGDVFAEALEIRKELEDPTPVVVVEDERGTEVWTARDFAEEIIEPFLRNAYKRGFRNTHLLEQVALGKATPLEPLIEPFIREQDIEGRSKDDHRRAVKELIEWAATAKLTPTIEAFGRKAAGRYVTELLNRPEGRGGGGLNARGRSETKRYRNGL